MTLKFDLFSIRMQGLCRIDLLAVNLFNTPEPNLTKSAYLWLFDGLIGLRILLKDNLNLLFLVELSLMTRLDVLKQIVAFLLRQIVTF